ncbi:hypothetical protein D7B24_008792 [Verticillium nonalfalfae]|uniref:Uncharacterized protein n=1 Tax=Verticillium nonalfalfae TaxID=1051616 RepID=A0A3M9Y4S0_9PEZI|nr:uncharacterized protein D7B24_008792 [Verticillium nonalfalfae]RNJ55271.1 hypothetical protein D7B24_008792 [Verticillium nonalfalfae]
MVLAQARPGETRHLLSVEHSLQELQAQIVEYQQELASLQRNAQPLDQTLASSRVAPFEIMKSAFDRVFQETPFMPASSSVLPALLSLRQAHQTVDESRAYIATQEISIERAHNQLLAEKASLNDQSQLTASLEKRIESLNEELNNHMDTDPGDAARERMNELRQKQKQYARETSRLLKDLNKFIDEHLASQLAAEDLGGPVVGDMMDVDVQDLAAGFNAQGRPKKLKATNADDGGKRQRRLEEVWGAAIAADQGGNDVPNETAAAGREMRELTEELLNQLVESGGDGTAAYVKVARDTAAARFLVRSKVAQFHPRDATRIRLIDFGKELDD